MVSGSGLLEEIIGRLNALPPDQKRATVAAAMQATAHLSWVPNPGPQTEAVNCQADELFFGGQAGGGKSSTLVGLSVTEHERSIIFRREKG